MFADTAFFTVLYGPPLLFVVAAMVTAVAAVYSAVALRGILRRSHYAWGETNGRVTHLERALEVEKERLQALRRIIMRGERTGGPSEVTQPAGVRPRPSVVDVPDHYFRR